MRSFVTGRHRYNDEAVMDLRLARRVEPCPEPLAQLGDLACWQLERMLVRMLQRLVRIIASRLASHLDMRAEHGADRVGAHERAQSIDAGAVVAEGIDRHVEPPGIE